MSSPSKVHPIPPRIVIPDPGSKDQRWLIKYRAWDESSQKFVMMRDYTANDHELKKRPAYCKERIKAIQLGIIKHVREIELAAKQKQSEPAQKVYSIIEAIDFYLSRKKRIKHFRDYKQKLDLLGAWLLEKNYHKLTLKQFTYEIIEEFLNEELAKKSIRTKNNYIGAISGVFNTHNKYKDDQVKNPTLLLEKDRNPVGKNIAYTEKQQKKQLDYIRNSNFPQYELAVKTMFYSLARTDELFKLQRWMIGAKQPDQIWFPDYICKNGIEKTVTITADLHQLFITYGVYSAPPSHFVFTRNFLPGPTPYKSKYAGNRFRENVLEPLLFSKDYTFYSWKHTGVCMYYKAGVSIAAIQQQAGWTDPQTFKVYLKSLGLFDNSEIKAKSPKLPG